MNEHIDHTSIFLFNLYHLFIEPKYLCDLMMCPFSITVKMFIVLHDANQASAFNFGPRMFPMESLEIAPVVRP